MLLRHVLEAHRRDARTFASYVATSCATFCAAKVTLLKGTLAGHVAATDAPVLPLDAAMLLVETVLCPAGAEARATGDEVPDAIDDLVRSREAIRIPDRNGVIIRRG